MYTLKRLFLKGLLCTSLALMPFLSTGLTAVEPVPANSPKVEQTSDLSFGVYFGQPYYGRPYYYHYNYYPRPNYYHYYYYPYRPYYNYYYWY